MCGIAGWYAKSREGGLPADTIARMSAAILHRGPDGEGTFVGGGVALAHRRLAIIDLSSGQQPLHSESGDSVIVFNGEIYNYRELRQELQASGARFLTHSDTEVILELWRTLGPKCVDRLRGMFAFAIYDRRDDSLFIARDRFGIKPLYLTTLADETLAFASELKSLLTLDSKLARTLREDAVADFFALGYVPEPKCIIQAVRKLPPAHWLWSRRGVVTERRYWDLQFPEVAISDARQTIAAGSSLIEDSVRAHLVADVPVSTFLSGGVDSGVVSSILSQRAQGAIAHTIGFRSEAFDESAIAARVATGAGLRHEISTVDLPAAGEILDILRHYDEPFADSSAIPTFALCRAAARTSKVALSGDGGDEAFGGYPWYMTQARHARYANAVPRAVRARVAELACGVANSTWLNARLRPRGTGFLIAGGRDPAESLVVVQMLAPWVRHRSLFTEKFLRQLGDYDPIVEYGALARQAPTADPYRRAQYLDYRLYLPGDILPKVDRASMKYGLEVRVPFVDSEILNWVVQVPTAEVFLGGQRKGMLREIAKKWLPQDIVNLRKRGFSVPLDEWFEADLGSVLEEQLRAAPALAGIVNLNYVSSLLAAHRKQQVRAGSLLFALLAFAVTMNVIAGGH